MRRAELAHGARPAALSLSLLVGACGTIAPQVEYPKVSQAPAAQASDDATSAAGRWDSSLAGLREADQRVADIAYRIVTANLELCTDRKAATGLVLQTALAYSPHLRPQVEAAFHIDDRAAVEAVAAGSPAAAAGVRRDDILLAVNGRSLPAPPPPPASGPDERPASYAPVEAAVAALDAALAGGPARVGVSRGGRALEVVIEPRPGCAYDAQVLPGPTLHASADGRHVFISAGLVDYAQADDMLALVLGHEFAHDVLHHHDRLDEKGFARSVLGEFGSTPASHMVAEKEADYAGLYLTARAGYDIARAPEFWRRFPSTIGDFGWSHPGHWERAASLAATRDEIMAKRQRGEPLTPNPAGADLPQ